MGVRTNGLRKGLCVSLCVFVCVRECVSAPLLEVNMRQTENRGQGERGREPRQMREEQMSLSLSSAALLHCAAVTLSPPCFPTLPLLPFAPLLSLSPISPLPHLPSPLSRLHFASAAAKQAAIAQRMGGETSAASSIRLFYAVP